jgi:hypothetical protein
MNGIPAQSSVYQYAHDASFADGVLRAEPYMRYSAKIASTSINSSGANKDSILMSALAGKCSP